MGLLAWFGYGKKPATDYDTLLARLSTEINEAKTNLAEIRLRERRFSLLLNLYGISLWVLWIGVWWLGAIPWGLVGLRDDGLLQMIEFAVIIAGPVGLIVFNRVLRFFYSRQRQREELHLRKLLKDQHTKLEEVKKATNYYATKELLDKYDASTSGAGTPQASSRRMPQSQTQPQGTPTPASRMQASQRNPNLLGPRATPVKGSPAPVPLSPQQLQILQQTNQMNMQPVLPTPEKKWYDHLADKLMGEDPSISQQTKYALVCSRCFRHNGLVGSKEEWENMKWYCRNCNFFNIAPKDRKAGGKPPGVESTPATPILSEFPVNETAQIAGRASEQTQETGISQRKSRRIAGAEGDDKMEVDAED